MKKGSINWFNILIVVLFFGMLFISSRYFKGRGDASIGIAQTRGFKINSEKSALVKSVKVVPGMQVKEGELLIELTSQSLEIDIARIVNRIATLKSEREERAKLAQAEISYLKAQKGIELEEIDGDIALLKKEIAMNDKLLKEFAVQKDTSDVSPLQIKIQSLEQQKERHNQAQEIKVRDVLQESSTEQQLLENQIILLDRELALLKDEQIKLNKYAQTDGVVKNVYVKEGEQVDSFTALLEVNPVRPTTVIAYLIGKKSIIYPIGSEVLVNSFDQQRSSVKGKVIGYGSVSELPEILQKSTATRAYGQEVFIEVSADNQLANGEKVLIR